MYEAEISMELIFPFYTDHVSKLNFRQEGARSLNQTQSVLKHFNANELAMQADLNSVASRCCIQ